MTDNKKGFGTLSPEEHKAISSKGGKSPKKSPSGFAAMPKDRLRELSKNAILKRWDKEKGVDK